MAYKFEALPVFQEAHKLVLSVYKTTKTFPQDERFDLVSQLRRAVSSIAANIVEGNGRIYRKEFVNFLSIATGSLEETKYHLLLSRDLRYINQDSYQELCDQTEVVGRQLTGLLKYWQKK
jgi:four helix bundle protein